MAVLWTSSLLPLAQKIPKSALDREINIHLQEVAVCLPSRVRAGINELVSVGHPFLDRKLSFSLSFRFLWLLSASLTGSRKWLLPGRAEPAVLASCVRNRSLEVGFLADG